MFAKKASRLSFVSKLVISREGATFGKMCQFKKQLTIIIETNDYAKMSKMPEVHSHSLVEKLLDIISKPGKLAAKNIFCTNHCTIGSEKHLLHAPQQQQRLRYTRRNVTTGAEAQSHLQTIPRKYSFFARVR